MAVESIPCMLSPDEYPYDEWRDAEGRAGAGAKGGFMRVEAREFALLHGLYVDFWNYARSSEDMEDARLAKALKALNSFYEGGAKAAPPAARKTVKRSVRQRRAGACGSSGRKSGGGTNGH